MKTCPMTSIDVHNFRRRLGQLGYKFKPASLHGKKFPGIGKVSYGHGVVFVIQNFTSVDFVTGSYVTSAVGRALLAREHVGRDARAVVVGFHDGAPPKMIAIAEQLGVEFLTPDELVESLKGKK